MVCYSTAGQDYTSIEETVTFDPDQSELMITVPLINDRLVEGDEIFRGVVSLSSTSPGGIQIGARNVTTITITDDDCEWWS